jgi:hypothetical protein
MTSVYFFQYLRSSCTLNSFQLSNEVRTHSITVRHVRGSFKFKREFSSLSSTYQLVWTCLHWQVMTCLNLQPILVGSLFPQPSGAIKMAVQAVPSSVAQRIIIKFLTKEGVKHSLGMNVCHSQGRDHVENEPHARRPRSSVNPDNVLKIGELIRANCRITILELSQEVGISVGSVEEILHNELEVSKVSARWFPRLLSPEHRERRLVAVTQLLQRYERKGAEFLDSVVTCDETWVHYVTSESKRSSKQWKHTHSPTPPKKRKQFFQRGRSWLLCSGIPRVSFTWTFSLVKKPLVRSTIQLSWIKNWSRQSAQSEEKGRIQFASPKTTPVLTLRL